MPPASGVRCRAREDIAWEAVEECSSDVALLYGAAHSAAFCRRAESEGWEFVKRIWVDAMVIPDETVRLHQWLSLGGVVALVCGVAAYDWLAVLGSIIDDAPHPAVVLNVSLYFVRHIAAYLALRKWYGTWEKEEAT